MGVLMTCAFVSIFWAVELAGGVRVVPLGGVVLFLCDFSVWIQVQLDRI